MIEAGGRMNFTVTGENGRYPPTQNGDIRSLFCLFLNGGSKLHVFSFPNTFSRLFLTERGTF